MLAQSRRPPGATELHGFADWKGGRRPSLGRGPRRVRPRVLPRGPAMPEVERNAPTVEEALEAALAELGVSEQEAEVEIVQEPRSGLLGIGGQDAVVRVRVRAASQNEA